MKGAARALQVLAAICLLAGATASAAAPGPARVDAARAAAADSEPHNWLLHGRTHSEQRFSPLNQIDRKSVPRLGLAWSYATDTSRGLEATPLIIDGVLYATGSWSVVYALDAASGKELWRFDPEVPREAGRKACCDVVNRGVAAWQGKLYLGSLDGRLIAIDAATGRKRWEVMTVDPERDYTITGAPRIVKGKVIIGNGGAEFGVRGYFSAYDAESGALLWRFYTVPGPPDRPVEHPELTRAAKTWSADSHWESGLGGTVWDSFAYDAELDLLYAGVGNSSPYARGTRSPGGGDNLFLSSILAVRPDSGKLVWHYQTTPGENWDYTATQHMILADIEIAGRNRRVLMQAPKNGFFYVLDRATGELLSADEIVDINWASHVDLASGRPVETGRADWSKERALVMPGVVGAHNWHPMSYSPQTGLVYVPTLSNLWSFFPQREYRFQPGNFNTGEDFLALSRFVRWAVPFCSPAHLTAWDPAKGRQAWRIVHDHPVNGGVLTTAGGLIFQGYGGGRLSAYAADTGERLWQSEVGMGIMAPPVTYAVEGEQYLAVLAGLGGSPALNYANLHDTNEGRILAYKLGGTAPMPEVRARVRGQVAAEPMPVSRDALERGEARYATVCARCHGVAARSTGFLPDLRFSSKAVHDSWDDIVLGGALRGKGMAGFADLLSQQDSRDIHAYVIDRAMQVSSIRERAHEWAFENLCVPNTWLAD